MKYLLISVIIAVTFTACQPHFADPETEDRVELLEDRIVKLEEQLRILRTTLTIHSNTNDTESSHRPSQEAPVRSTAEASVTRQSQSSGYSEGRSRSSRNSSSYSGRCQATTRKGTQCKRTSRSGGYCWQHGG